MKIKKNIILGIFSIFLITSIISCNNTDKNTVDEDSNIIENKDNTIDMNASSSMSIKCLKNANDEAGKMILNIEDGNLKCDCDDCSMVFSSEGELPANRMNPKKVTEHFIDYLSQTHNTENYGILSYDIFYNDLHQYIEIKYIINEDYNNYFTVVYHSEFETKEDKSPIVNTWFIDNFGTCDTLSESYVRCWDEETKQITCKCTTGDRQIIESVGIFEE